MATTYTTRLRLAKPTPGELTDTWGAVVNAGLTSLVDDSIAGIAAVTHDDSANYTLTANNGATDEARCAVLSITGTLTAARNVVCPTQPKQYVVVNATTGGYAITLKTTAGTGISVAAGTSAMLRCDGTNVIDWIPVTGTGANVLATSPTLVTPALGTPTAIVLTNATGTAASLTAGVATVANGLKSATTTVAVSAATAPSVGQVLTATGGSSATWQNAASGPATGLVSATTTVSVSAATAPSAGQVLTATSSVAATWQTAPTFPAGTVMLFAQTAAPTGWTKSVAHNDKALRVVSGTASSGGSTAFTTVFASRTPAGTVTVGDTTLTTAQIPAHTHTMPGSGLGAVQTGSGNYGFNGISGYTGSEGGGGSHTHSGSLSGTAMDFAVQYVDVILATKD